MCLLQIQSNLPVFNDVSSDFILHNETYTLDRYGKILAHLGY